VESVNKLASFNLWEKNRGRGNRLTSSIFPPKEADAKVDLKEKITATLLWLLVCAMALVETALPGSFFSEERRVEDLKCGIFKDWTCRNCQYRYGAYCAYDGTDLTRAD
jgi:hypothetical protein